MTSTREQIFMIHTMCWKEFNLLKINLDKYIKDSERCKEILSELNSTDEATNIFGLIVFDRYMTQMVTVLNEVRKCNIKLEINNLDRNVINASFNGCFNDTNIMQTRLLKDFIEWRNSSFENDVACANESVGRIKITEPTSGKNDANAFELEKGGRNTELSKLHGTKNACDSGKTLDISNKIENLLDILLPIKNLSEFENGFEFEASIVSVRDYRKLEFFICVSDDYKTLYDLSSNISFKRIPIELLPTDDVFCIFEKTNTTEGECLWRAVIVPEDRPDEHKKCLYLLDFGVVIPLTNHCKIYEAPLRYREIPPLAIKCILEGVEDSFTKCNIKNLEKCKRALQECEFLKTDFRIVNKKNRVLHVVLLEKTKPNKSSPLKKIYRTNPFLHTKENEIDDENATKNSDALQLPRSVIYQETLVKEPVLNNLPEIGNKIQVIVTHVLSPISFYGIIQNHSEDNKTFSWNDRQIFSLQRQISRPQINDIVLSQYIKDGYWYRAKVISLDSVKDMYKVFYVDFGNTEVVHLSNLAKCSAEQLKDPLRAVLFHLSNLAVVSDIHNVDHSKKTNFVIESMVVLILDQVINVEVIERRKDGLVVRIIDSQYADIPKMLVGTGVVKEINI